MSKYETVEERRAKIYPVILSEYNPEWPKWYAEEKANLEHLIGMESNSQMFVTSLMMCLNSAHFTRLCLA